MRSRSRKGKGDERPVLSVRPGSTLRRDVYKTIVAAVTGLTAFGALAVTGAVAGTAAHDQALKQREQGAPQNATSPQTVLAERRTHETIVSTRVVREVSGTSVTRTGAGGIIRSGSSSGSIPTPAPSSGS